MTLAERLKGWRGERSQAAAAALAGVSQAAWCQYENGDSLPRADVLEKLISLTAGDPAHAVTLAVVAAEERDRAEKAAAKRRATGTEG